MPAWECCYNGCKLLQLQHAAGALAVAIGAHPLKTPKQTHLQVCDHLLYHWQLEGLCALRQGKWHTQPVPEEQQSNTSLSAKRLLPLTSNMPNTQRKQTPYLVRASASGWYT